MTNLKFLGKHPIRIELFESSTLQSATAFSQLFPYSVLSITLSDRGLFTVRGHTFKEHVHTRTHKCNTPYYSLLICWALIETPLSLSHTCNSSLIISEGAFGGGRGGGGGRRGLPSFLWQATCASTVQAELNCQLPLSVCFPFPP